MRRKNFYSKGFTLIELLIVVALIGLITLVAVPQMSNVFKITLNSSLREISSLIKEIYNDTAMTGRVHRLAYNITDGEYWAESGPATLLLDTLESREQDERKKRFGEGPNKEKIKSAFKIETSITKKKRSLPQGVSFEDILTEQSQDPITSGLVYTHFFPHGITEQTIIHLKDGTRHQATLVISPIVGRSQLFERYVKKDEIFRH
jgi:prepilin-type N-terminal cleavage/methylation domain-containing protein